MKKLLTLFIMLAASLPAAPGQAAEKKAPKAPQEAELWDGGIGLPKPAGKPGKKVLWERTEKGPDGQPRKVKLVEKTGPAAIRPQISDEALLALAKKYDPALADKLASPSNGKPAGTAENMAIARKAVLSMRAQGDEAAEKTALRVASLEIGLRELQAEYEKSPAAQKPPIREKMKAPLSELFDIRAAEQAERLKNMEAALARLKAEQEKRAGAKEAVINGRLDLIAPLPALPPAAPAAEAK